MPKKKGKKEKKEIIMIKNNKNNPHKLNPFDMFRLPATYTLSSQIVGVPSPSPSPPLPPKNGDECVYITGLCYIKNTRLTF